MNAPERKAVSALAAIFALRMFGLFMLLPVLAPYAARLEASTPLRVGLALGVYGLTQGLLQIPFGMMSDRFGRKIVIAAGLGLFIVGSAVAALADSIEWLIIGRAIQGAGAISSAVLALTADLTRARQRTKAMAVIGVSIGAVFLLSLMLAPPLASALGVPGIFWLTAVLALAALGVLRWIALAPVSSSLPSSSPPPSSPPTPRPPIRRILAHAQLLRLNLGVFVLHLALIAMFVVLPTLLHAKSGLALAAHWRLYAPVLILSVVGMLPLIRLASRPRGVGPAFTAAVALLLASCVAMAWAAVGGGGDGRGLWPLLCALWLFFVAFNALEAMLPSLVSRIAPAADKGAALGVFNTFQFLGMFAGGVGAGWISGWAGAPGVYWLCAALVGAWLAREIAAPRLRLADE
ncbi:MAG: MFS transporter [bacterium]